MYNIRIFLYPYMEVTSSGNRSRHSKRAARRCASESDDVQLSSSVCRT